MLSMISKISKGSVGCTPNELCVHTIVSVCASKLLQLTGMIYNYLSVRIVRCCLDEKPMPYTYHSLNERILR